MKIYISGKITGDRCYKAKFREVEKKLAAAGHIVLNPATAPEGLRRGLYAPVFRHDGGGGRGSVPAGLTRTAAAPCWEWAWLQYVGKQTCYDPAVFGGPET